MAQKTNRLIVGRRTALALAWALTVVTAGGLGWVSGRLSLTANDTSPGWETGGFRSSEMGAPLRSFESQVPATIIEPPVETTPTLDAPTATETPPEAIEVTGGFPDVVPTPAVASTPSLSLPEPAKLPETVVPAEPIPEPIFELIERADRLAEGGDPGKARSEAQALLGRYADYTGLTNALVADGIDDVRARLDALRVLQLAGLDEISTELARELKRSYASTPEVLLAIHDWRILKPKIISLDTSIEKGERVVVTGELENPDIGSVRRVLVEVVALDAAGNVLATEQTRVRPRAIDAGGAGSFTLRFTTVDPSFVVRTRATVTRWQSEVLGGS